MNRHSTADPLTPDERRAAERAAHLGWLWVGVIVPLGILLVCGIIALVWLPQSPDPAAMHWSGDGPDGFGPPWMNLVPIGVGAVLISLFAWFARRIPDLPLHRPGPGALTTPSPGEPAAVARFPAATGVFVATITGMASVAVIGVQRGLSDATQAPEIGGLVGIIAAIGVVLAVAGWFAHPKVPPRVR